MGMTDSLRELIDGIQLIDQHAHPGFAGYFEDFPPERRVLIAFDPYVSPEESSSGFPYLREVHYEAYLKIYGFSREVINNPLHKDDLVSEYDRQRNNLKHLIDKTMDAAGVEFLISNSFQHNDLKNKSRIKFIPSIDPFLFPFDNTYLTERSPLTCSCIAALEHVLNIIKVKNNFSSQSFEEYLAFVDRVIANFVKDGAVGFNFHTGYIRTMYFEKVEEIEGSLLFERAKRGVSAAYKRLQDLLVWHIMRKSVEYDLPVQWHCSLFDSHIDYTDCLNLAEMLLDPIVGKAKIVLVNGNYPRFDHAETLALSGTFITNNVYIDISGHMMLKNHPKILAGTLRKWLEKPLLWDKIMYGSNAYGGERYIYVGSKVGRDAVYFALKGMIDDTIIDEKTAMSIASKILRENALKVYKL
jgi:predicted TIM-barrel fold metal-dependent hydrolase